MRPNKLVGWSERNEPNDWDVQSNGEARNVHPNRADLLNESMDPRKRIEIISAFGAVSEKGKSLVGRESDLPFPKELIRLAMAEELASPTLPEALDVIEAGFIMLESFVSDEEHLQVQRFELALESAQQLKDSGDKISVLEAAKALAEVSDAATQVLNRVDKLTDARFQQLAQICALRSKE